MISFRLQTRLTGKEEKVCLDNCLGCLLFRIFYVSHIYQLKRQFINIFKWFFSTRKQFPAFCFSISNLYESLFQYFFLCGSIVFIIPFLIYWFFLISRMCVCMCVCVCVCSLFNFHVHSVFCPSIWNGKQDRGNLWISQEQGCFLLIWSHPAVVTFHC